MMDRRPEEVLALLRRLLKEHPALRVGQLIYLVTYPYRRDRGVDDIFHLEDKDFVDCLLEYARNERKKTC